MKFSFIIPALNEEKYIGGCVTSIVRQLTEGDEVIVVDNGSTDKTREIAKKAGARVVREKKKGISYARNRGAQEACGDILCFIDADGKLAQKWLSSARKTFNNKKVHVISGINIFTHESKLKKVWYNLYTVFSVSGQFMLNLLQNKLFITGNNMAIRKELFWKLGGFEPVIGEDYWLSKRFWAQRKRKGALNFQMVVYLSSRGFDATGYVHTLAYWTKSTLNRVDQKDYNYKNKPQRLT